MISQTAEYSLRVVVCLAGGTGRSQTTQQIAAATKIPPGYLCKVLQALSRAGLVTAQRGLNGGFTLQRDPASLSLLEIVRVTDHSHRIRTCPLGIHGTTLCALHRQLDNAAALAENALTRMTLAELVAAPSVVPPRGPPGPEGCSSANFLCSHSGDSACLK